jgi:hypothetical protein
MSVDFPCVTSNQLASIWVSTPTKKALGEPCLYKRVGANKWQCCDLKGRDNGDVFSDFEILVFISNGAKFVKGPKGAK